MSGCECKPDRAQPSIYGGPDANGRRCPMRSSYRALTIVIGVAVVLALGQILIGEAPAQGGGAVPGQEPGGRGGGARGGGARGAAALAGPIVPSPDGKPDFTGYWISATKTNINN